MLMPPNIAILPPPVMTKDTASAVRKLITGMYIASSITALMLVRHMRPLTSLKVSRFLSSITRVFEVSAPEIPSL